MKRNKNGLTLSMILVIAMTQSNVLAQQFKESWKFEAGSKILASPVEYAGVVYVGDESGFFYAVETSNGKEKWRIKTDGNIQARALVVGTNVYFESANVFYMVNAKNGKEIWHYDTSMKPLAFSYQDKTYEYKIDPYDDKRSGAMVVDGIIYVGSGNGTVYGFEAGTGKVKFEIKSDEGSPIRSSPLVNSGKLYFGDWNGVVYCYDLESEKRMWRKKTYRGEKPYGTFGGVVSEFVEYDGLLFFGARNYMMNVLSTETGEKEWTYTDPDRGWIIGDPVIYKDTLYIGGSDNLSMYAFHPQIGQPFWRQNGGKNIYTKPVVTEEWVFYTSGNSYNARDKGLLYMLNRRTGEVITKYETPNSTFSSPVMVDDKVIFGCYDGFLYCLEVVD